MKTNTEIKNELQTIVDKIESAKDNDNLIRILEKLCDKIEDLLDEFYYI